MLGNLAATPLPKNNTQPGTFAGRYGINVDNSKPGFDNLEPVFVLEIIGNEVRIYYPGESIPLQNKNEKPPLKVKTRQFDPHGDAYVYLSDHFGKLICRFTRTSSMDQRTGHVWYLLLGVTEEILQPYEGYQVIVFDIRLKRALDRLVRLGRSDHSS
jgi:hypothetical protein